jgi:hypothetical protein
MKNKLGKDNFIKRLAEGRHFSNWFSLFLFALISSCTPAAEKLVITSVPTQTAELAYPEAVTTRLSPGETSYPLFPTLESSMASPYPESILPAPLIATSTPRNGPPRIPQLAGLIYWNSDGLWQIQANGSSASIFEVASAQLSQDGNRVLFVQDADIWLADLTTGEKRNLTDTPDRYECCPQWWPARSDLILLGSSPSPMEDQFFPGHLTALRLDDQNYRVLDSQNITLRGFSAPSPDGLSIAYGAGWIYQWNTGSVVAFNPQDYGITDLGNYSLYSPAWSPDNEYIAWTVQISRDGQEQYGTGIFDLETLTGVTTRFFQPVGFDGPIPHPRWSPDGKWIAIDAFAQDLMLAGVWIIPSPNQTDKMFQLEPSGGNLVYKSMTWSPDSRFLAISESGTSHRLVWVYEVSSWRMRAYELNPPGQVVAWLQIDR